MCSRHVQLARNAAGSIQPQPPLGLDLHPQNEHTTPPESMHEPHALSNVIMVFMARRKKLRHRVVS